MSASIGGAEAEAVKKRSLGVIFFIMLIDIIGLTIIIPVVPFIVQRFSTDAFTVTALTGIYAAMQFLAAPAIGKLSDRFGRKSVLLVCLLGSAIGYVIFGIGGALWILFLSRVLDGITGGNLSTAAAVIADISTPEERPKNFGLIGMAYGIGFILGPALGGAASQISLDAPAFVAALLALVSVALVFFLLPETLPPEKRSTMPLRPGDFNPLRAIGGMLGRPGLGILLIISCLFAFAFDGINSVLNVYVVDKFAALPWQIGLLFVVSGLVIAFTQALFVPRVVGRFGEKQMAIVSQLGLCLGAICTLSAPAFWWLFPNTLLMSGIGGFVWSTMGSMVASKVNQNEQGQLAGVNTALQSLMAVCGPLAAGAAYDSIAPTAPFWISAGLFLLAALLLVGIKVQVQQRQQAAVS